MMFHLVVSAYSEWSGLIVLFGRPLTSTKWINTVYQLLTVICSVIVQFFFAYRLRQITVFTKIVMTIAQLSTGLVIWIREYLAWDRKYCTFNPATHHRVAHDRGSLGPSHCCLDVTVP
ncbi:uncharacterized protein EI90DRAFT_1684475 [Cantharellus anzutake]|uniref:uncharacterized protein n=1 Tax=Cantharellus anzutake TaxID=1750568 RepID=UPI0019058568|nr:uncharacterized protein EI90DRAFT_1684475 [Cantharellus anzutake]KAF8327797.1 hypothetical protein EI90DRAFT_1684475 [Cantharellus anzutake]